MELAGITIHTAGGGWDLGWEALVAIGTLLLSIATGYLAWKTRALARETALEVAAQNRPVLVPGNTVDGTPQPLLFSAGAQQLEVDIRNAGRGPALDIDAVMEPANLRPQTWHKAALSPNSHARLNFAGVTVPEYAMTLALQYRDLANQRFESRIMIERVASPRGDVYRFADVTL